MGRGSWQYFSEFLWLSYSKSKLLTTNFPFLALGTKDFYPHAQTAKEQGLKELPSPTVPCGKISFTYITLDRCLPNLA